MKTLSEQKPTIGYVFQGHRYDIYEELGCVDAIVNTPLTFVFLYMWPVLLGSVSAIYSSRSQPPISRPLTAIKHRRQRSLFEHSSCSARS